MIIGNINFADPTQIYVIAEVGVNHEGDVERAKELIDGAKEGGAHAVKFQTYKAETLAAIDSPAYWDVSEESTQNQFELFKKFDSFSDEDYKTLSDYCKKVGIDFASTPFSLYAVDLLDPLVSYFKIASADITNYPLIREIATKNKQILLSTGASNIEEIRAAIHEIRKISDQPICVMHCILNYPTAYADANLRMISHLRQEFPDVILGYSDHTKPDNEMTVLSTAVILGAQIIEKHFTLDKGLPGNDHYHSMDVKDLQKFFNKVESFQPILGKPLKNFLESEIPARANARRSLHYLRDLECGETITAEDLIALRPASGIQPNRIDEVIGKILTRDVKKNARIDYEDFN